MKRQAYTLMYPRWTKWIGWALILWAVSFFLYRSLHYGVVDVVGASFPVAMGLILIFFSREKEFDERIVYLKFKSLALSVPMTAILVSLINYSRNFSSYSVETDSWYSISAFEFLSITLIVSIGLFHYLRYKE